MIGRGLVTAAFGLALCLTQQGANAGTSIVVDAATGRVLHNEDSTRPWYPASLSKLMTAYVVFKAIHDGRISGSTPITISARAAKMAPSKMGYPPGTLVTVDDALKMLIVHSANDIAVALAEGVSGSVEAFAAEMNANSQALGMTASHWVNPNGLPDPGQISSARDMAILARAILTQFPDYAPLYKIQAIQTGKRILRTHNALVYRYPGTDGMKTGFICAAGFNVVATASRDGRRLITVIMGSPSAKERTIEAAGLFEANFREGEGSATLDDLPASAYATPPDIRDIACSRKKGGSAAAEQEDTAEVLPPPAAAAPRSDDKPGRVVATVQAEPQPAAAQPQAPAAGEALLLANWTIDPPIMVGPYKGPKRPAKPAAAIAAAPPSPPKPGAIGYAEPAAGQPLVQPTAPVDANVAAPLALPGTALGAIRPGAPAAPQAALPGQIPRTGANPLQNLTSDPLPTGKPRRKATTQAAGEAVPVPVPRPVKKKKPKPQPQT
ncbi:D-alanyl-D-alanine carboxypeptidase family protein [Labrys wisconsinensis]|uniref:D-alanyl-D-alanine carboxypeptidase n=1 Tax=Labrys wisconsinensis TaxID=425677 RepID=A0ABU0J2Q1_9HYPH|nr:D-alanyl-D-alanine carboxypeptidase family protein [Labrys wisconsinensis]MDQ0467594.1 D-alanyl-D-alanine carboxypeptidase [Labrys wisconsinensis]